MKASFWKLVLAYFIDWVIVFLGATIIGAIFGAILGFMLGIAGVDAQVLSAMVLVFSLPLGIALQCLYFALMEHIVGASVGKMAMKIVVSPKN